MAEELSGLKTDIALIKKDVKQIEVFFNKFDSALATMSDVSQKVAVQSEISKNTIEKLEILEERIEQHRVEDIHRGESISIRLEEHRRSARDDHQRLSDINAINRKERNDEIMKELHKMNSSLDKRLSEVDERIKTLENLRWYLMGTVAVLAITGSQLNWAILFG
jgi:DNA repair exonuclease SbcCD ATPase subunit